MTTARQRRTTAPVEVPAESQYVVVADLVVVRRRHDCLHLYRRARVPDGVAVEQLKMLLNAGMIEEVH